MTGQRLDLPAGTAGAGATLHWNRWLPASAPRAIVLLVHGYAEHLGRYEHVAAALNGKGFGVYALDHWGHGKSDGVPGFVPAFSAFTDGVEVLLKQVEQAHPGVPLFLIGHSLGGLIAALHLRTHQAHYAGAVLSGPAIMAAQEPSRVMIWISRLLSKLAPQMGVLQLDATGVSRDPAVVAAYRADPLVYSGKMGARLAKEMFEAMSAARAGARAITLPMLLLHGEQDSLAAPQGSEYLHSQLGSRDKTLKLYPGLYHEIFNEPEHHEVLGEMTDWLEAHLPQGPN